MFRGLYNAVSTMNTAQKQMDAAANNMANVNTTAYKRDLVITEAFPEVLISKLNGTEANRPYSANVQVNVERQGEGFRLDTAGGFFAVSTRLGISFQKSVAFAPDEAGFLRTYERDATGQIVARYGNYILDASGNRIQVPEGELEVDNRGQVLVDGEPIAALLRRPGGPIIGTMNSGQRLEKFATDFSQGSLEQTWNTLDLAVSGSGFFVVYKPEQPDEMFYTRDGHFTLNDNGDIVTQEGYFLGSVNGTSILVDGEDFAITPEGLVLVDGQVRDQLEMVDFANLKDLRKLGESLYRFEEGFEPEPIPFEGQVLQGYLERANVNSIDQMVEMINLMRAYEAGSRVVRTYDEVIGKAINEIGR